MASGVCEALAVGAGVGLFVWGTYECADYIINQSKNAHEREGDGTRNKTADEIKEAFKDKLTPGELKKLLQKVEKLRKERNIGKQRGGGG
jgi:hypothetical protein